jgi:uncharacterized protein YecE (DUF72 family)
VTSNPIRIGCAGWNIPREVASQFAGGKSHLERYARVLNCVEINTSFYRPHRPTTWERWRDSVPAGFQLAVKMPRSITHEGELNCEAGPLLPFLEQVGLLGEKLGPILIQLPPSLSFDPARVSAFFSLFRQHFIGAAVCEPRHPTWFSAQADELLREFQIARVAADPACVSAAATPGGDPTLVYYRLHGSPRRYYSAYSDDFLRTLATQLRQASAQAKTWCIFDNTASGAAIGNALELASAVDD